MPFDKTILPAPPAFPASNASYNKIVGNMHKAALGAGTSEAAIAAVTMIASHVGGVNTYAKATRRYGDKLIEAINGPTSDMPPEKVATELEKAAAEGDQVAGFMLKGAKATKAAKSIKVNTAAGEVEVDLSKLAVDPSVHPGGIKVTFVEGETFSDKSNARRALKRKNLDHLPVTFEPVEDGRVRPVVTVTDDKGIAYASERGIKAKVAA